MPERITPKERLVSLAIEKARKAKEELTAKKRENIEPTQIGEVEHEAEDAKLKRPKAQADTTKIKTQSEETHSGYGLAGQEMKKSMSKDKMIREYLGAGADGTASRHKDLLEPIFSSLINRPSKQKLMELKEMYDTLSKAIDVALEDM